MVDCRCSQNPFTGQFCNFVPTMPDAANAATLSGQAGTLWVSLKQWFDSVLSLNGAAESVAAGGTDASISTVTTTSGTAAVQAGGAAVSAAGADVASAVAAVKRAVGTVGTVLALIIAALILIGIALAWNASKGGVQFG